MQYPTIAQPQYGFAPTMPMMPSMSDMPPAMMGQNMPGMMGQTMPQMNFKKGGLASLSLPEMAEKVQDAGRRGDTMLAHITPEEAGILQLLGGSGTINPETGQPEYFKKFFRSKIFQTIAPMLPFLIPGLGSGIAALGASMGGLSALASKAIASGIIGGFTGPKGGFDLKRAAITGGTAFAGGKLMEGAQAASGASGSPGTVGSPSGGGPGVSAPTAGDIYGGTVGMNPNVPSLTPTTAATAATQSAAAYPSVVDAVAPSAPSGGYTGVDTPMNQGFPLDQAPITTASSLPPSSYQGMTPDQMAAARGAESTISGVGSLAGEVGKMGLDYAVKNPQNVVFAGTQIAAAMEAKKELEQQKEEAERIIAAQDRHTKEEVAFAQDVLRRYPVEYRRLTADEVQSQNLAGGGLAGLNAFKAGGSPRFLKGGGDGMSDDIPAMIGKRQKAALSDGEFVVPADVVSHLGNGSSRAGAKKLYSMMDNIRQARTGKKRQAPEVKPDRYMPA